MFGGDVFKHIVLPSFVVSSLHPTTEFTCILERSGKMSGGMICYVFFRFLFISSKSLTKLEISAKHKDSRFSFVILLGNANPSRSSIYILLVDVAVSIKTVSFFDKRLLIKT